jgi:hypothetical protein
MSHQQIVTAPRNQHFVLDRRFHQSNPFNVYMLYIYQYHHNQKLIHDLVRQIGWRVRSEDEYELDPSDVHCIGSDSILIQWQDTYWHVDDFMLFLVDIDIAMVGHRYVQQFDDETIPMDRDSPDAVSRYQHYRNYPPSSPLVARALDDSTLSNDPIRHLLHRYFFWFAIYIDTRVERLICKADNVLHNMQLGWPAPIKIRNMRDALGSILRHYAYGYWTISEFDDAIRRAYETGLYNSFMPDTCVNDAGDECAFRVQNTFFDNERGPWFIIRSEDFEDDNSNDDDDDDDENKDHNINTNDDVEMVDADNLDKQ